MWASENFFFVFLSDIMTRQTCDLCKFGQVSRTSQFREFYSILGKWARLGKQTDIITSQTNFKQIPI